MSQVSPKIQLHLQNKILLLKEIINNQKCVENILEELQNFFLDSTFRGLPINILNEYIFDLSFLYIKEKFNEIIKNINKNLKNKNNLDNQVNKNQFSILMNVLKYWNSYISHVSTLEKMNISNMKNIPTSFFEIIIEILSFCKIWAKDHGKQSVLVTNFLTSIFHQCIDTLNSFYILLDSVILFDTKQANEMENLVKIIDYVGKLATLVMDTDLKILMDMWKYFGKISTRHCLELKSNSPNTITYHFKGLAKSIINVLLYIHQQSSSNERPVICCRFLIKILEKLCDAFYGCIQNDVMTDIIIMITNLYMYTGQNLEINGYNSEFIKFFSSNLTIVIEPFLEVAIKNNSFKMGLLTYGKNVYNDNIGYHLLLLTIMKKISTLSYVNQREWCYKKQCILNACFQNIDRLTKDICTGKLQIELSRNLIKAPYMTSIYEATCLRIFELVCQTSSSDFFQLIILLLKYLLNGKFFSSLLSSDVWCFICRLGSSETCYSHFKYLTQIYEILIERKNSFNVIMLYNLIGRQYNFLLEADKIDFFNNLIITYNPHSWSPMVRMMNIQEKKCLQTKIDIPILNDQIASNLKILENQPSLNSLSLLLKDLSIMEINEISQDEKLADIFIKTWNKIVHILSDCEGIILLLLQDFAISLLRIISPQQKQIQYMTSILESIVMMYPYASDGLRLEFCRSFYRLSENFSNCHKNVVADLVYRMLSDNDPFVHQEAFETFEKLTLICHSVDILSSIALAIKSGQADLSKILSDYIGGTITYSINLNCFFINLCDLQSLESLKHACHQKSQINLEKISKLSESVNNSCNEINFEKQAIKVCADMELMLKIKRRLKKNTYNRLCLLCQKFLDQNN